MATSGRHRQEVSASQVSVLDTPGPDELRQELLSSPPSRWDRLSALALATVVLAGCGWFAQHGARADPSSCLLSLLLIGLYVAGFRTEFRSVTGGFVATEPVLVAMVFALPWGWAPLVVLAAVALGSMTSEDRKYPWHSRLLIVGNVIHCLGPMGVLLWNGDHDPRTVGLGVLALALLAQFTCDGAAALIRGGVQGVTPRQLAQPLLWTFAVDALLAPIGFCIVVTAQQRPAAYLLLAAPIVLVRLMKADREAHRREAEEIKSAYSEVREQVQLDPLTGLHNRRGWDDAVSRAAAEVARPERRCAIVIIADVDHLKMTNDTYGHDTGDLLLQEIGHILTGLVPQSAMVARLGGDEFGAMFTVAPGYPMPDFVRQARAAMEQSTLRLGHLVSASLGVAVCPPGGSVTDAVRRADHAAALDKAARRVSRAS